MNLICKNKRCRNNKDNKCMVQEVEITYHGICSMWEIFEEINEREAIEQKKG